MTRDRTPVALIDWEIAGPVRRDIELAQACWLNTQLVDDDIGERLGLSFSEKRAEQVSLLLDGYGLARSDRVGFFDQMLAFAVHDAAEQAIQAHVTMETQNIEPLWAITWRTRSASWMLRNRSTLERLIG